jgi:hypothetical protein
MSAQEVEQHKPEINEKQDLDRGPLKSGYDELGLWATAWKFKKVT